MPRFFFDTFFNGRRFIDDEGTAHSNLADVRTAAMAFLPALAKDTVPKEGDQQAYTVMVRDRAGKPIYSATLTFAGAWLSEEGMQE